MRRQGLEPRTRGLRAGCCRAVPGHPSNHGASTGGYRSRPLGWRAALRRPAATISHHCWFRGSLGRQVSQPGVLGPTDLVPAVGPPWAGSCLLPDREVRGAVMGERACCDPRSLLSQPAQRWSFSSARPGQTTLPPAFPGRGSSVGLSSAASSASTSEPSKEQVRLGGRILEPPRGQRRAARRT